MIHDTIRYPVDELLLFSINHFELVKTRFEPIINTYARRMAKGIYDGKMIYNRFRRTIPSAIRIYNTELNSDLHLTDTQKAILASEFVAYFYEDIEQRADEIRSAGK